MRTNDCQQRWVIYTKQCCHDCKESSIAAWILKQWGMSAKEGIPAAHVTHSTAISSTQWSPSAERLDPRKRKSKISLGTIWPKGWIAWNAGFPWLLFQYHEDFNKYFPLAIWTGLKTLLLEEYSCSEEQWGSRGAFQYWHRRFLR